MFRWFCLSTFSLRDTTVTPLASLLPGTHDVATCDPGSMWVQSTELDIVGHCAIYLSWRSRWFHLDLLVIPCWGVPIRTKQLSTVTALLLSVLVTLVSHKVIFFFYIVSALQLFCMSLWKPRIQLGFIESSSIIAVVKTVGGGGQGGGNLGVMGLGRVREAGEEGAGDRIPKGAGVGRNRNWILQQKKYTEAGTTKERGGNGEYKVRKVGNSDSPVPPPPPHKKKTTWMASQRILQSTLLRQTPV